MKGRRVKKLAQAISLESYFVTFDFSAGHVKNLILLFNMRQ
jgi:hypothetical protein